MIARVASQIYGGSPTDDRTFSDEEILFCVNAANWELTYAKQVEGQQDFGIRFRKMLDPSLLREFDVAIDGDGSEAQLPSTPITLPFDQGIQAAFYYDSQSKIPRQIKVSNYHEVTAAQGTWWPTPRVVRTGDKVRFFGVGQTRQVRLVMLSFELPRDKETGTPNPDAPYPIRADLVNAVVARASEMLMSARRIPADTAKDLKSNITIAP
jgi:hypothetical protein